MLIVRLTVFSQTAFKPFKPAVTVSAWRTFLPVHHSTLAEMSSPSSFYDFKPLDKNGKIYPLSALKGKVVLVVNTATGCGFAPQLKGLEELSKSINASHPDSFVVLAFPSDHFNQEKRSGDALQEYCEMKYKASYPILGPVGLNGHPMKTDNTQDKAEGKEAAVDGGDALFEWMKKQKSGLLGVKKILWNFEKFLIGKDGKVKERWTSVATPAGMESRILAEVKKGTE